MATLQIDQGQKIGVEQLLLGDVEISVRDCNGNLVQIHGLMANDLQVKTLQGDVLPLTDYIISYTSAQPELTSGTVTSSSGNVVSLVEVVDAVEDLQYDLAELQEQYNNG